MENSTCREVGGSVDLPEEVMMMELCAGIDI